ncbi:cation diffusion facilitator like membrane transporter [Cryptosporidium sp. chipmunk genotype I]|uniref:cation diffusion facilitator like membrane transporter n=1 Tax=Cryptosporidium sp. chipmunk genotype I TaxID=1280935 RepID=UPI00351A5342|nr:cation diffusion facilitator like membrane transporter [Cryptosporidium sp. chipmunk genotype I]
MKDSGLEKPLLAGGGFKIFANTKSVQKRLIYAIIFCLVFTLIEVVVGVLSNSLALISDASHLISDICSYLISLFGIHLSKRKATNTMSFGYHRAEILGALLSILLIWFMTIVLVYEAIQRMLYPVNVDGFSMFITAIFGTLSNLFISFVLSVHNHGIGSIGADCTHQHNHCHEYLYEHEHKLEHGCKQTHNHFQDELLNCKDQQLIENQEQIGGINNATLLEYQHRSQMRTKDLDHEVNNYTNLMNSPVLRKVNSSLKECSPHQSGYSHLHSHNHHPSKDSSEQESLALKSAYIHVIGDILQNIGVMIAGLLILYNPDWTIADPLCTILFSFFVLTTTIKILKDSTNVLMEGTPVGIDCISIQNDFLKLSSVLEVHDLHVWSVSVGVPALSCHIVVVSEDSARITLRYATDLCQKKYGIFHTTIQIDYSTNKAACETIHHQKCLVGSNCQNKCGNQQVIHPIDYSP